MGSAVGCTTSNRFGCGVSSERLEETVTGSSELSQEPIPPVPNPGTSSIWTIEYGVPLEGASIPTNAPAQMGENTTTHKPEPEKWAQKDDPKYATSIFPPDEPQGWPASDYKRATTYYMDNEARTVNVASPAGGVSTTEYNETNDVTRTLSADDRTAALKEKEESKSKEVAELLDTKSKYGAEGTQLTKTLGPQHMVKLVSGKGGKPEETLARNQVHYYYDEGAPGGETYDLATKTVDDARTTNGEEFDKRTSTTSYGGQKGLGWTLREPTSTTTDPDGLDLTKTTVYEEGVEGKETTGAVVETKTPAASAEVVAPPYFSTSFGSEGTGAGQFKRPVSVALDGSGDEWVVDKENERIEKFSSSGAFIEALGWGVSNGEAKYETCTSSCRAGIAGSGAGQFSNPWSITVNTSTGDVYVSDSENDRIEEFSSSGEFVMAVGWGVSDGKAALETCKSSCKAGIAGSGEGQLSYPLGLAIDSHGDVWVAELGNNRVQEFSSTGAYVSRYVADTANNRIEEWVPANEAVHDTRTIYYTAKGEATVAACREHPEWVNLPCQTEPAAQPTDGLSLPITTITYNMWDQPETTTEKFGSTTRTKKTTFDSAGRPLTSEVTSSIDEPLPTVTDTYNTETGALETQSTTTAGKTKTITTKYNTLGQPVKYTDADGSTTTYSYEEGSDGRLLEVSTQGPEGEKEREKGKQTYSYDPTTGFLTKLVDSAGTGITFTASYDVEGHMTSETYPNGMTATYTTSSAGQTTGLEYKKTTHCTEKCTWFSDTVTPSIHGETLTQTSTLSKENYAYDNAGRLTEVQETPAGKDCTESLYAYNEESDRTSLTTRESGSETCPTEGGSTERHTYDEANRLTDEGITYEAFGNTTKLPATDAGKYELTTSYYVDGQAASQTQDEKTIDYHYDPEGRTRETETTTSGKKTTTISHYSAPGETIAWTSEEEGKAWTRNIPGIDGTLTAIQSSNGTTTLQLHDLKGDIVATASPSETETKLLTTYNSSTFGVPSEGKAPPKYAWFGADGVTSELASGTITQDGKTYIPLTGRPLQTQPVEVPLPVNSINPYVRPNSGGAVLGEIFGAEGITAYRESQHATGGGSGGLPSLEGSEALAGSCSGDNACTASYSNCEIHYRFGEPEQIPGVLWLTAAVKCNRNVAGIQIEAQILVWNPHSAKYEVIKCNHSCKNGEAYGNVGVVGTVVEQICVEGLYYKAWVWGYAWGPNFWFTGAGKSSEAYECTRFFGEEED
jgi:YD repeat-containing protein